MRHDSNFKLIPYILLGVSILGSSSLHARMKAVPEDGGLKVYDPDCGKYWFKVNGQIKADETIFTGNANSKRDDFPSGAFLRAAELSLSGGLGKDLSYSFTASFDGRLTEFTDAYLKYSGISKQCNVFLGQVPVPFGFENSTSSKWISFLERSMPTVAFAPNYGVGAMVSAWGEMFAITVSATRAKQGLIPSNNNLGFGDKWGFATRLVFSPLHTETEGYHEAYHFSVSARYQDVFHSTISGRPVADIRFRTRPEGRARHTSQILDTGFMRGKSYTVYGAEVAGIWGPFTLQGEYTQAHVQRIHEPLGNPRFHGWYAQASYILTGESRVYHFHTGTLGRGIPQSKYGAWEVAIRQSYLNLNSKDVFGGKGHNTSFSLGCYVNKSVRIFGLCSIPYSHWGCS